jgi:hypothetical protein
MMFSRTTYCGRKTLSISIMYFLLVKFKEKTPVALVYRDGATLRCHAQELVGLYVLQIQTTDAV